MTTTLRNLQAAKWTVAGSIGMPRSEDGCGAFSGLNIGHGPAWVQRWRVQERVRVEPEPVVDGGAASRNSGRDRKIPGFHRHDRAASCL